MFYVQGSLVEANQKRGEVEDDSKQKNRPNPLRTIIYAAATACAHLAG